MTGPDCLVISQPMYFPWPGLLEQIRMCETFVHYSDVQFSKGSFTNRVQIKTAQGIRWLSVPLRRLGLGQRIDEVATDESVDWRRKHCDQLRQAYADAPFRIEMLNLVEKVFSDSYPSIAKLSIASTMALARYFTLDCGRRFHDSSNLDVPGASTSRVVDICRRLNANRYLTGHGARNYLDHARFESHGIGVFYAGYSLTPYPQQHGPFMPYVTALDLVANCGKAGVSCIAGQPIPWRQFLASAAASPGGE
ncbi:MAG: WbqC family protein [Dokdonella sp.]